MNNIKEFVNKYQSFAVVSHISPDGDAVGSALALFLSLKKMGKQVGIYCKDKPSYDYIPHIENYRPLSEIKEEAVIFCDCGDVKRCGYDVIPFENTAVIDHHISNNHFCTVNLIEPSASSTCEMMFDVIKDLGVELDCDIARCIYFGIITDTNNFTNSNVRQNTFNVAGELINYDFDYALLLRHLYRSRSKEKLAAIAKTISSMQFYFEDKLCIAYLTKEDLKDVIDSDGIVNYTTDINGVSVGVLIKQVDKNKFKISMRSNNEVNVSDICAKYGGGGHVKAAGCVFEGELAKLYEGIVSEVSPWME